jgi:hypothetical protein
METNVRSSLRMCNFESNTKVLALLVITESRISVREIALYFWDFEGVQFRICDSEFRSVARPHPRSFGGAYAFWIGFFTALAWVPNALMRRAIEIRSHQTFSVSSEVSKASCARSVSFAKPGPPTNCQAFLSDANIGWLEVQGLKMHGSDRHCARTRPGHWKLTTGWQGREDLDMGCLSLVYQNILERNYRLHRNIIFHCENEKAGQREFEVEDLKENTKSKRTRQTRDRFRESYN